MRIVFLGTPAFAVPALEALIEAKHDVVAVFTQPDRPKGRGGLLAQSPVKEVALRHHLHVLQPERIRRPENIELLRSFGTDLMVVVGYGQIIPQSIIDLPRHGILNIHASLLPKLRGAAPIQWSLANGDTTTGVTVMQIDAGLDTGDTLSQSTMQIAPAETAPELSVRLATAGASLLLSTLPAIEAGTVQRKTQDGSAATYAPILKKEDGLVDWSMSAATIYNRLRGFTPWPGAFTTWHGQKLMLVRATPASSIDALPAGTVLLQGRRLFVACGGHTFLEILELQLEGKKRMEAAAFLNGVKLKDGEKLGD